MLAGEGNIVIAQPCFTAQMEGHPWAFSVFRWPIIAIPAFLVVIMESVWCAGRSSQSPLSGPLVKEPASIRTIFIWLLREHLRHSASRVADGSTDSRRTNPTDRPWLPAG